jgi:DHA1 family bicyclomycin/chloramphenicol resistance-like MFS transporter
MKLDLRRRQVGSAVAPGEPAGRARLALILGGLTAFGPLSLDMYLPGLPSLARDLGASAAQAQLTLTACLLGVACGQLMVGSLSDSLGRRLPLLLGLVTYAVCSLLCAVTVSAPELIAARFLQGAAGGAGIVIARAVARDLYSGVALARFFGVLMLVNGSAPVLAPVIGGQLLRVGSWRTSFFALALIGGFLLVAAGLGLPETLPRERRRSGGLAPTLATYRRLLGDRQFVGYALCCGLAIGALFTYIAGSPFVLEGIYGLSPQGFSLVFATNAVGIVSAGQVSARLVARVGARRLLAAGLISAFVGGLALLVAVLAGAGLYGILPALFVVVSSGGLVMPNAIALALADQGAVAGSASALLGLCQFVIGALAAPLAGIAGPTTAVPMALVISTLTTGALICFVTMLRGRPAPGSGS